MPSLDRESSPPGPVITGFTATGYICDGKRFDDGLWLTPDGAEPWHPPDNADLTATDIEPLTRSDPPPEFILLGTGVALQRPSRALVAHFESRGIGIEAMDSRAAARSWGVLRAEERRIVAALMPLNRA